MLMTATDRWNWPTRDTPEASHCESMVDETIAASIMSILNV